MITSRSNPKIKQVRALRQRKKRKETGLFLAEGIRPVGEAVQAGAPVEYICYSPDLLTSEFAINLVQEVADQGIDCVETTKEVFTSIAEKENPMGLIAVVRQHGTKLEDLEPQNFPWGIALVSPQDPGNLGTISRTVDAVGASGILILGQGADIYHPTAVRASMGAIFWHPVVRLSFTEFSDWIKQNAYNLYGTSAKRGKDLNDFTQFEGASILLMGSERQGLSFEQSSICQQLIRLPMKGRATSLTLAVAAGILLYDMSLKMGAAR